ncbi:hypothetical protein [Streptomyces chattanoogensis]|uniref:hypothetical protein n=1 Tax=Streptomyces chattanoogensis TaxID=66876 RepID=UPI0006B47B36|nr:hypothetical protein [Streptomyces chattanoogensis]
MTAVTAPTAVTGPRRFPPEAVRDVRIFHVCQTGCGGPFAIVTVDFEPLPDDEFAPVVFDWPVRERRRNPEEWLPGEFVQALEQGVRNALDELPDDVRAAAWCTVTDARWHLVDSHERGFTQAGAMAVREALRRSGM